LKITAIYCGGCNPEIDREALVKQIVKRLGKPVYPFSPGTDPDLSLFINGCPRQCVNPRTAEGWSGKAIVVAGLSIDAWEVSQEELVDTLLRKINEIEEKFIPIN